MLLSFELSLLEVQLEFVFAAFGREENGEGCFAGIRAEVVAVEVADEVAELALGKGLERWHAFCCDDECRVIGIGVHFGVGDGVDDVVDVEEEEGGG